MVMHGVINELKMVSGVFGGFFFHRKSGLLLSDVPPMFKEPRLNEIGRQLGRVAAARHLNFPDILDINLYFDEIVLVARVVQEKLNLILVCEPSVNTAMLSMAMRIALDGQMGELESLADRLEKGDAAAVDVPLSPEEAIKGPLRLPLESIEQLLAGLMGPMAELIFEETLEKWVAAGKVGLQRLPQLIEMLGEEMADETKASALKKGFDGLSA